MHKHVMFTLTNTRLSYKHVNIVFLSNMHLLLTYGKCTFQVIRGQLSLVHHWAPYLNKLTCEKTKGGPPRSKYKKLVGGWLKLIHICTLCKDFCYNVQEDEDMNHTNVAMLMELDRICAPPKKIWKVREGYLNFIKKGNILFEEREREEGGYSTPRQRSLLLKLGT